MFRIRQLKEEALQLVESLRSSIDCNDFHTAKEVSEELKTKIEELMIEEMYQDEDDWYKK